MVLNLIWVGFFLVAFATALVRLLQGDAAVFPALMGAMFDSAKTAPHVLGAGNGAAPNHQTTKPPNQCQFRRHSILGYHGGGACFAARLVDGEQLARQVVDQQL